MVYFLELEDRLVVAAVEDRVIRKKQVPIQHFDAADQGDKTATAQVVVVVEYYLQALSVGVLAVHRVVSLAGLMQTVQ
jgi:hypothetical protein